MGVNASRKKSTTLLSKLAGILLMGFLLFCSNNIVVKNTTLRYQQENHLFVDDTETNKVDLGIDKESSKLHNATDLFSGSSRILQLMDQLGSSLTLSRIQQTSFEANKDRLPIVLRPERRFQADLSQWGANLVNDQYAYIHIFKNGGTTIAAQTKQSHMIIRHREVQRRKWFTVVRDPIEHFLSGWAECGTRDRTSRKNAMERRLDYDLRIQRWLQHVRYMARPRHPWNCVIHSFPQVNMFLNARGMIPKNLEIVGNLKELPAVLKLIGFDYNTTITTGRNATEDSFIQTYFPKRPDLLSDETIRSLCDFLAIDYFLLDYPLPKECSDMGPGGYTNWTGAKFFKFPRRGTSPYGKKLAPGYPPSRFGKFPQERMQPKSRNVPMKHLDHRKEGVHNQVYKALK